MAKYVIEIPDDQINDYIAPSDDMTFRISVYKRNGTFSHFVRSDLSLTPYTEPDRKAIEDEVWEFATICTKMNGADSVDVFGGFSLDSFTNYSYQEAKAKYEAWRKQKNKIRVGDELINHLDRTYVIYDIDRDKQVAYGVDVTRGHQFSQEAFSMHGRYTPNKTGRYFPEVAELMKKMREES